METIDKIDKKAEYAVKMQEIASMLIKKYKIHTVEANTLYLEELWVWKNNFYNRNGESTIHSEMFFEDGIYNKADYSYVLDKIKGQTRAIRSELKEDQCTNILNGTIHYEGKVVKFVPREETDYKHNFSYIIPVSYNPNSKCPEIDKIISDVLETQEKINLYYEFVGSILLHDYRFKKALIMAGVTGTGKTSVLNPITQFCGDDNVSSVSLNQMDTTKNRFAAADLDGKKANIVDEMPKVSAGNYETFKCATGGGSFRVEKKGKDGYNIINAAKMIFTANELPYIEESIAESFYGRVLLLELTKIFDKPNVDIKDKKYSEEEMSGYLNHVMEGLQRLLKKDDFSQDTEDVPTIWNRNLSGGSRLKDFIGYRLEITNKQEDVITKSKMYVEYVQYKMSKKETPMNVKQFGSHISRISGIVSGWEGDNKAWRGIQIKKIIEDKPLQSNCKCGKLSNVGDHLCSECRKEAEEYRATQMGWETPKIEQKFNIMPEQI